MNGADSLIQTALAAGVDTCFANPGTTEMQLVAALDAVPGMRSVLGLFEGVCTGAADGYGRMTGRPALTLLHLGPGFANGIANLHNARRAGSPVVNLVGDHATFHAEADAPLTSDIHSLARPVSGFVHSVSSASHMSSDVASAIEAALGPPSQVATLIIPQDAAWETATGSGTVPVAPREPEAPEGEHMQAAEEALRKGPSTLLLLGDRALRESGLRAAARITATTGCGVMLEGFPARLESGGGLPSFPGVPYFPEQAAEALARFRRVVLVGAKCPVAFFGYRNQPSSPLPDSVEVTALADRRHDAAAVLQTLASELAPNASEHIRAEGDGAPAPPSGKLDTASIGLAVCAALPSDAIVVNEAATSGGGFAQHQARAARHTVLNLTGGAIGQGLPSAVGAAIACPQRPVIALQADGSAMYTLQALWTMAREGLNVTVVLCSNRSYRILRHELRRAGVDQPGARASALTSLNAPPLDWTALAKGHGVPACAVHDAQGLNRELHRALREPGPNLIEVCIGY